MFRNRSLCCYPECTFFRKVKIVKSRHLDLASYIFVVFGYCVSAWWRLILILFQCFPRKMFFWALLISVCCSFILMYSWTRVATRQQNQRGFIYYYFYFFVFVYVWLTHTPFFFHFNPLTIQQTGKIVIWFFLYFLKDWYKKVFFFSTL